MEKEYSTLLAEFENENDLVGLWQIFGRLRQSYPRKNLEDLKETTLNFIELLISTGFLAGDPPYSAQGFQLWKDQNASHVIQRIATEWKNLGQDPDVGDIVWFCPPALCDKI